MNTPDVVTALLLAISAAPRDQLHPLHGRILFALGVLVQRLVEPEQATADSWLSVPEAAALFRVPESQIRKWAHRKGAAAWSRRPTPRTLQINERRFREYLATNPHRLDRRPPSAMKSAGASTNRRPLIRLAPSSAGRSAPRRARR